MTQTPTDALRLVPVEPTREMWAAGGTAALQTAHQHHDKIVETVWAAMLAAAPSVQPDSWQDISTAPKDGTEINGYRLDQGVFTFRWALMEELVPKDSNGDPAEDYDDTFAWWWHDRWGWMEGNLTPTHWCPLPVPPAALPVQKEEG